MAKVELKTKPNTADVESFVAAVEPASKRADAQKLLALFSRLTGEPATMWGPSMIGFGSYDYRYDSGHSGTALRSGFSPRKAAISLYLMGRRADPETEAKMADLLSRFGKYKEGKACLYVNKLADIDLTVLEEMIALCWAAMNRHHPHAT